MKTFKNIILTIIDIPLALLIYLLVIVVCVICGIIAAPFAFIYGLVYFIYDSILDIWKGESIYAK